jgi:hypothetical protein
MANLQTTASASRVSGRLAVDFNEYSAFHQHVANRITHSI